MSIIDTIKSKIAFLKKEGEDEFSDDFGDFEGAPSPDAEPEPFSQDAGFENTPTDEYQHPEPETFSEPEHQPQPQPQYQHQAQPSLPFAEQAPLAPAKTPASADLENLKLNMDNIKQRIENIMHRFDALSSELDAIKAEAGYEKTVLSKYDYYLRDLSVKLDTLEKQHEAIWHEIKNNSKNPL